MQVGGIATSVLPATLLIINKPQGVTVYPSFAQKYVTNTYEHGNNASQDLDCPCIVHTKDNLRLRIGEYM